jgi:hypothetical protein
MAKKKKSDWERKIVRLLDADYACDASGEAVPHLTYDSDFVDSKNVLTRGGADATLEELVGLCDHHAENVNAHDFYGAHRLLGAVLFRHLGRELATKIMLDIAMRGGLSGMSGVCEDGDSFEDLGVGKAGHDWDGTYGDVA